ncbi:MAG: dihydroorotase [Kofleriaceae bacterium]
MDLVLRGGRVVGAEPSGAWLDVAADVRIRDGRIVEIAPGLRGGRELDVAGRWIAPGLCDLRAHLGEPGGEHREDLTSGARAAAHGGFTTVCALPDTTPINDQRTVTELIVRRAAGIPHARIRPIGAVTRGFGGERLADIADMVDAGIVAVADGDRPIVDAAVLRRALEYARTFGVPLVQHAEDLALAEAGVMHEGALATRVGLRAHPACAETAMVARDLEVVAVAGGRYHLAHASAAGTVALLRAGKRRGLPITAEVSPLHLALTEDACAGYDPCARLSPPLRGAADRAALIDGLVDGTIDVIASDHRPCGLTEKEGLFEEASPGAVGLETALALVLALVADGQVPLRRAIEALTVGPARAFGLGGGVLAAGEVADLVVIDPDRRWQVGPATLVSKSGNTPLRGHTVTGQAVLTLLGGQPTCDRDGRLA